MNDASAPVPALDVRLVRRIVDRALQEDIGTGDITTAVTIARSAQACAEVVSGSSGVLAGMPVLIEVFRQVDPDLVVSPSVEDGTAITAGDVLCTISGPARSILMGERVALNFVQRLSGIATRTAQFVERVRGTSARIADTRKTTPGLRALEKYAVNVGGGHNHRMGLYDAVMIKDNHIAAAGSIADAVARARRAIPHTMTITVECETPTQVDEAIQAGADILLLDNMDPATLAACVRRINRRAILEASGGVSLDTISEVAAAGVDVISVGALTHSAPALDIRLDLRLAQG